MKKIVLSFLFFQLLTNTLSAQIITTIAGGGSALGDGGAAVDCQLASPIGIAVDNVGSIYIADRDHNRIRKINTAGIITSIAGTGVAGYTGDGGLATDAKISAPYYIAIDDSGNIFFTDNGNNVIRKISTSGDIKTIAGNGAIGFSGDGGPAIAAELKGPVGIALDNSGNVYFADQGNNRIRMINAVGIISTVAGTGISFDSGDGGSALAAGFEMPQALAMDLLGDLFVTEYAGERVRKITPAGIITTIAGGEIGGFSGDGGPAVAAKLDEPLGIAIAPSGNVYISDFMNHRIRMVNTAGIITTIAGGGGYGNAGDYGPATLAKMAGPLGLALDNEGNIYVADGYNDNVREISSTLAVNETQEVQSMKVFPNPTSGDFTVSAADLPSAEDVVSVYDITGRLVESTKLNGNNEAFFKLRVSPGLYLIDLVKGENHLVKKISIQ